MTKTALENKKLETQASIADKDRAQKEKDSKRRTYVGALKDFVPKLRFKRNDVAWYTKYIQNENVFSQIPTFTRLGDKLDSKVYPMTAHGLTTSEVPSYALPGLASICLNSTVGSQRYKDMTNIALNDINQILMRSKQSVLKLNSRSNVDWEGADLGLNLLATADIIVAMGQLASVIQAANLFSTTNNYYPSVIIQSYGYDPEDVRANLSLYEKIFETLRLEFNFSIVAPSELSLYERKWMLATSVIKDSNTDLAQNYNFVWNSYLKLNDVGDKLDRVDRPAKFVDSKAAYTFIHGLMQPIIENPSYIEMYSDLRMAFGSKLWQIPELPKGTRLEPYYNEEVLNQIKNLRTPLISLNQYGSSNFAKHLVGSVHSLTNGFLWDGTLTESKELDKPCHFLSGSDKSKESHVAFYNSHSHNRLINLESDNKVGYGNILEATRLCPINIAELQTRQVQGQTVTDGIIITPESCGTEVPVFITIFTRAYKSTGVTTEQFALGSDLIDDGYTLQSNYGGTPFFLTALSTQFDWFPTLMFGLPSKVVTGVYEEVTYCDINKYFIMPVDNLNESHTFCNLSLFYLPDSQFQGRSR